MKIVSLLFGFFVCLLALSFPQAVHVLIFSLFCFGFLLVFVLFFGSLKDKRLSR